MEASIILINADKNVFTYRKITSNTNYLTYSKLQSTIINEFDFRSSYNLRVYNFNGIEITDDSDLSILNSTNSNDKIVYFTFGNKTSNKLLINCFKFESKIGEGGFGKVYLARQIFSNKMFAIKYIRIKKSKI